MTAGIEWWADDGLHYIDYECKKCKVGIQIEFEGDGQVNEY